MSSLLAYGSSVTFLLFPPRESSELFLQYRLSAPVSNAKGDLVTIFTVQFHSCCFSGQICRNHYQAILLFLTAKMKELRLWFSLSDKGLSCCNARWKLAQSWKNETSSPTILPRLSLLCDPCPLAATAQLPPAKTSIIGSECARSKPTDVDTPVGMLAAAVGFELCLRLLNPASRQGSHFNTLQWEIMQACFDEGNPVPDY